MAVGARHEEYMVRLTRAPAPPAGFEAPRPVSRHWHVSRKLVVLAVLSVLVLLNRSTVEGWVRTALDQAEAPLRALQADEQLRKAEDVLVEQWQRDRTYDVTTQRLAELDTDIHWNEIVRYRICFGGTGAVITADTATGTRSQLFLRGADHGVVNGDPGCPANTSNLRPWGLLAR